jgi:hypothetical protein
MPNKMVVAMKPNNPADNLQDRRERGQSLIELAVSFTLLLLILGVTIDLGRVFYTYIAIREAAEEGALYGSNLNALIELLDTDPDDGIGPTPTQIKDAIRARVKDSSSTTIDLTNWIQLKNIPDEKIKVYFTNGVPAKNAIIGGTVAEKPLNDVCSGDSITVYIQYDFYMFMPVTSMMTPPSDPLEFKYYVTNKVLVPLCDLDAI